MHRGTNILFWGILTQYVFVNIQVAHVPELIHLASEEKPLKVMCKDVIDEQGRKTDCEARCLTFEVMFWKELEH